MIRSGLQLINDLSWRDSTGTKDAGLVNAYVESYSDGRKLIVSRPGMKYTALGASKKILGAWYDNTSTTYFITYDGVNSRLESSTAVNSSFTNLGNTPAVLTTRCDVLSVDLGTNERAIAVVPSGSGSIYIYNINTTAWTTVNIAATIANFNAAAATYIDGYIAIINGYDRRVYCNTNPKNYAVWNALTVITPEISADRAVDIRTQANHLVVFSEKTVEFFYNAGFPTPGSPFAPRRDIAHRIGTHPVANRSTWQADSELIAFVGTEGGDSHFVALIDGLQLIKVSNEAITRIINSQEASFITAVGGAHILGKTMIFITTPNANQKTYVFDTHEKLWYHWKSGVSPTALLDFDASVAVRTSDNPGTVPFLFNTLSPSTAEYSRGMYFSYPEVVDTKSDTTTQAIAITVQTSRLIGDTGLRTLRKRHGKLRLICDTAASTSNLGVSWSDDDGATWSSARNININLPVKQLTRLGDFRERMFRFTYSDSKRLRIEGADLEFEYGKH